MLSLFCLNLLLGCWLRVGVHGVLRQRVCPVVGMLRKEGTGGERAPWSKLFLQTGLMSPPCLRTLRLRKVVPNSKGKAERMRSEMFYSLRHLDDVITRIDDGVVTVGMMVMAM